MTMRFRVTDQGGRIAEGDSQCGTYRVEWDAAGKLTSESLHLRTPETTRVAADVCLRCGHPMGRGCKDTCGQCGWRRGCGD